jgi:hypothetical protein
MRWRALMDELDAIAHNEVQPGSHVYDGDGQLIGSVERVGDTAFTLRLNGPVDATVEIGFDEIESADDGRVELAVSGDELAAVADSGAGS